MSKERSEELHKFHIDGRITAVDLIQEVVKLERLKEALIHQNKRYREALEFYADDESWSIYDNHGRTAISMDGGQRAHKVLKGER